MNERPDEFLVNLSRSGEHDAYAELVHRHLKRVLAICLSFLGDLADAEDAAHHGESLETLDLDRNLKWISTIILLVGSHLFQSWDFLGLRTPGELLLSGGLLMVYSFRIFHHRSWLSQGARFPRPPMFCIKIGIC